MLRTQQPVKILGSGNNFEIKDFQNRIKSQNRFGSRDQPRGPIKASYGLPEEQWQVRYQYRSPQKVQGELQIENQQGRRGAGTLQEGSTRGSRVSSGASRGPRGAKGRPKERQLEATSDYGTMSRGGDQDAETEDLLEAIPGLNLGEGDAIFSEVSVEERRERIDSVLDEILSVPRLVDANLTQRSLSNPRQMRRYLGGSERLSENGSRLGTTRSSNMSGRQVPGNQISGSRVSGRQIGGSQLSGGQKNQGTSRLVASGRQASQDGAARPRKGNSGGHNGRQGGGSSRQQVLRRAVSSPKLDLIPERPPVKYKDRNSSTVPKLQLDFSSSSTSTVLPHAGKRVANELNRAGSEDLSGMLLNSHEREEGDLQRGFGEDTALELAICPPTLGEETNLGINSTLDTTATVPRDFVQENMKVTRKELTGRSSAASSVAVPNHKAGAVPKYLKARQTEWREAEEKRIASIPDPDCPPGHRLLSKEEVEERVAALDSQQESLLRDLACLPVSVDTRRVRVKRQETEEALSDLEERLRGLRRAKVFVPKDEVE